MSAFKKIQVNSTLKLKGKQISTRCKVSNFVLFVKLLLRLVFLFFFLVHFTSRLDKLKLTAGRAKYVLFPFQFTLIYYFAIKLLLLI